MKTFLYKIFIFLALVGSIFILYFTFHIDKFKPPCGWNNWRTESNLLLIPEDRSYDICILGASNARVLSRNMNHIELEKILGKTVINLAQGGGRGGTLKNMTYLSYFFKKGNTTDHILYFLPPQTLYTNNYDQLKMDIEPFFPEFLVHSIKSGFDNKTLFNYFQSKFSFNWQSKIPEVSKKEALSAIDSVAIAENLSNWKSYEKDNPADFDDKFHNLIEVLKSSKNKGCKISFVFQVHLMGDKIPHLDEVKDKLLSLKNEFEFDIIDLSNEMRDPSLFYDHTHLNSAGVVYFTENILKPIVEGS